MRLPTHRDARGSLTVADADLGLPFAAERAFLVVEAGPDDVRGQHAHRTQHEVLIAARGTVTVDLDDGQALATVVLDHPTLVLHLPPLVWSSQRKFSSDACLVVLASGPYDPSDHLSRTQLRELLSQGD